MKHILEKHKCISKINTYIDEKTFAPCISVIFVNGEERICRYNHVEYTIFNMDKMIDEMVHDYMMDQRKLKIKKIKNERSGR